MRRALRAGLGTGTAEIDAVAPVSVGNLLENGEIARVPGLRDQIILAAYLAHYGIVDVLKILQAQILFRHDGRDQLVVFENVDGRALAGVGTIERSHDGVISEIKDIAGQGTERHAQAGKIAAVAGEAGDFGVRPVGDFDAPGARRHRNSVSGAELPGSGAAAAERQIVPDGIQRVETETGCKDEIKIRVAGGDI